MIQSLGVLRIGPINARHLLVVRVFVVVGLFCSHHFAMRHCELQYFCHLRLGRKARWQVGQVAWGKCVVVVITTFGNAFIDKSYCLFKVRKHSLSFDKIAARLSMLYS